MSLLNPNLPVSQRPLAQAGRKPSKAQPPNQKLSTTQRVVDVVGSPVFAAGKGVAGAGKGLALTALAAGGLAKTAHPIAAVAMGVLGVAVTPVYAAGKAVGSLFGNLKAGLTGYAPAHK